MTLEILKKLGTYDELTKYMNMIGQISKDKNEPMDNILRVDDAEDFEEIYYYASSVAKDKVVKHWFKYKENNMYGLAFCTIYDYNIVKATDAIYIDRCEGVPNMSEMFICAREDSLHDIVISDHVAIRDVASTDNLNIGYLNMLQVNFVDGIGVICFQADIGLPSLFVPKDVDDFADWYFRKSRADAYQGFMDGISAQDLFRIEFEVENTIFHLDNYKKIDME